MAKKIIGQVKLQIPAGKATPAPPVGPALGQHGVNLAEFTKAFNAESVKMGDTIVPVIVTIYADRSFSFILKTPPAAVLLKKAAKIEKGAKDTGIEKVGAVNRSQIKEIAQIKMPDLNANDLDAAMRIIEGTARSMGLEIEQ